MSISAPARDAIHLLTRPELERRYAILEERVAQHLRDARNYELTAEGPGDFDSFLSRGDCFDLAEAHYRWAGEDEEAMTEVWLRLEELS